MIKVDNAFEFIDYRTIIYTSRASISTDDASMISQLQIPKLREQNIKLQRV